MTEKITLPYNAKDLDEMNRKIKEATQRVTEIEIAIEEKQQEIDNKFADIANGTGLIDEAEALEIKLEELKKQYTRQERILQALEQAKKGKSEEFAKDIADAHTKAFKELQARYDRTYEDVLVPARKAFIEALAQLGSIENNSKQINGEMQRQYSKTGGTREPFRMNKELSRKIFGVNEYRSNSAEHTGFGLSEWIQKQAHDNGTYPNGF